MEGPTSVLKSGIKCDSGKKKAAAGTSKSMMPSHGRIRGRGYNLKGPRPAMPNDRPASFMANIIGFLGTLLGKP